MQENQLNQQVEFATWWCTMRTRCLTNSSARVSRFTSLFERFGIAFDKTLTINSSTCLFLVSKIVSSIVSQNWKRLFLFVDNRPGSLQKFKISCRVSSLCSRCHSSKFSGPPEGNCTGDEKESGHNGPYCLLLVAYHPTSRWASFSCVILGKDHKSERSKTNHFVRRFSCHLLEWKMYKKKIYLLNELDRLNWKSCCDLDWHLVHLIFWANETTTV